MNTKKNNKIFLKQNELLPTLHMYMVFVESVSPILFACRDDNANVYICSCHCQNAEKCEWIIAPTTYAKLVDLLTDKLSIKDIFHTDDSAAFVATMYPHAESIAVIKRSFSELENILPTADYYMEADPDEFSEELTALRSEISTSLNFTRISFTESFNTTISSFSVDLSILDSIAIVLPTGCFSSDHQLKFAV